jgi:hypothetical protein
MVSIKRKLCFRKQNSKNRDCPFNDLGKPQFFYKVVQSWVAFKLVQVLQKFGLNPKFKTNLNKWSKDMHCVVQFIKKIPQQDDEKKRAQVWVDILFHPKKPEHYGSFIRCEHGTKNEFQKYDQFCNSTGYFNMASNDPRIFLEK